MPVGYGTETGGWSPFHSAPTQRHTRRHPREADEGTLRLTLTDPERAAFVK